MEKTDFDSDKKETIDKQTWWELSCQKGLDHQRNLVIGSRDEPFIENDENISLLDSLITGELEIAKKSGTVSFRHYVDSSYIYTKPFFKARKQIVGVMKEVAGNTMDDRGFLKSLITASSIAELSVNCRLKTLQSSFFQSNIWNLQKIRLRFFMRKQLLFSSSPPRLINASEMTSVKKPDQEIVKGIGSVMYFFKTRPTSLNTLIKSLEQLKDSLVPAEYNSAELFELIHSCIDILKSRPVNLEKLSNGVTRMDQLLNSNPNEMNQMPKLVLDRINQFKVACYNLSIPFMWRFRRSLSRLNTALQASPDQPQHILDIMLNLRGHIRDHLIFTPEFYDIFIGGCVAFLNQKIFCEDDISLLIQGVQSLDESSSK